MDIQYCPNAELDFGLERNYIPLISKIEVKKYENKDKRNVVVVVKNHSIYNADFPEAYVVFFDASNRIVDCKSIIFADEDLELKSGETDFGVVELYLDDFDHAEVYLKAHSNGSTKKHTNGVTEQDIEIVNETYVQYGGNVRVMKYLAIKNNSNKTVEIQCNSIAWGTDGKPLTTGSGTIYVMGPGQTSILSLTYSDVVYDELDHTTEKYTFKTEGLNYTDVLGALSFRTEKNEGGATVYITNNGTETAERVTAYLMFYDSNDQLVWLDWMSVGDSDYVIKPGSTESKFFDCSVEFSRIDVYLKAQSPFKSAYSD